MFVLLDYSISNAKYLVSLNKKKLTIMYYIINI